MTSNSATSGRSRLNPAERTELILEGAIGFFAEHGLDASTRDLADRLGVAQGLIYRYFSSKQALLDQVFERVFARLWDQQWDQILADRTRPLDDRLSDLYGAYMDRAGGDTVRLFVRAGLSGADMAPRYSASLTEHILRPVIGELRAEIGLPSFAEVPMMRGERELAMLLQGAVVFLGIRKHVYCMPLPDNLTDLVRLQVRTFLDGARVELHRIHSGATDESLTVEQLDRKRCRR